MQYGSVGFSAPGSHASKSILVRLTSESEGQMVVSDLEFLEAWIPEQMEPGTVFVLEGNARIGDAANPYLAVLACPRCGCMGLIKRSQYFGLEPMICGGSDCSAEYFVDDDNRISFRRCQ